MRQATFFLPWRETGLVNGLFHSGSTHWNVGGPISLHCISDIIHGNNGDENAEQVRQFARD